MDPLQFYLGVFLVCIAGVVEPRAAFAVAALVCLGAMIVLVSA